MTIMQNPGAIAQNATMGTGIAADDMYRMSRFFRDSCSVLPLTTNGHRVLHALLHRTCRDLPRWALDVQQPAEGHRARCKVLRRTLGLECANSNRDLRAGISALMETNLFERIGFCHRNAWLSWRFDDEVLSCILEGGSYGLLDASALRMFRTVFDYQIYSHVSVARRTRKPAFKINLEQAAIWTDTENARWSDVSAGFLKALRLSCAHYGLTAVVLLDGQGYLPGIDTVVVRLRRPGSLWSASDISKCSLWTQRCLLIDGSEHIRVAPAALPDAVQRARALGWRLDHVKGS